MLIKTQTGKTLAVKDKAVEAVEARGQCVAVYLAGGHVLAVDTETDEEAAQIAETVRKLTFDYCESVIGACVRLADPGEEAEEYRELAEGIEPFIRSAMVRMGENIPYLYPVTPIEAARAFVATKDMVHAVWESWQAARQKKEQRARDQAAAFFNQFCESPADAAGDVCTSAAP